MNGHVVKRGSSYQAILYKGSVVEDGVRRPRRETRTFPRRTDAKDWLRDRATELSGPSSDMPLWAWVGQYLDAKQAAPKTLTTYRNYYENHIRHSEVGKVALSKLTAEDIEEFEHGLGMKSSSVRQVHAILRGALRMAQRKGLVSQNVAALVHPPKLESYHPRVISVEQAKLCLEPFEGWMRLAVLLAATAGLRRGEICALRWEDVSDDLLVRRAVKNEEPLVFGPTKSGRERVVPLIGVTREALSEERANQAKLASKTGLDYEWVVSDDLGRPVRPMHLSTTWREKRPLPIRFHDLRHSMATTLARNGAHPRTVQEILGHSDVATTLRIYTHVLSDVVKEDMGRLDEAWG